MKEKFKAQYLIIAENVRRLRKLKKLTQLELANRCSVNREQISRIENAKRDFMFSTLQEVCEALEVELLEIIQIPPNPSNTNDPNNATVI